MKFLTVFIAQLLCPSVDKTLHTFQNKIDKLHERIDLDIDDINSTDKLIDNLHVRKQQLLLNVAKAESAVEQLEKITS